jgi:hypothetical protein
MPETLLAKYLRDKIEEISARLSTNNTNISNLDVALSTRASEATLAAIKNALASVGADKLRASVVDSLPLSPFNLTQVGGTLQTARDWSADFAKLQNLDIALTTLSTLIRFGIPVEPSWIIDSERTAPAANTNLVSFTVPLGKVGYIFGFRITASEANHFKINWTSNATAKSYRITFPSAGTFHFDTGIAINKGLLADGNTSITITNVNAGSAGSIYQASLLVAVI